ncbi:unnamed protein product [Clonostachys byssicola]|uniref:RRM domain-containing protein n=1 Tax=Clonostachys byssicola TaxID=160290 RepID=A0A9N9UQ51_9HYPO|nr:unnamed protein product [Clonostachys byssicola]
MASAQSAGLTPIMPIGTPYPTSHSHSTSPKPLVNVLIRRLPLNTSDESLRLMVVWSKELADVEVLPVEQSDDDGFRSAILKFKTMGGAQEARHMLDGRSNISNDAEMVVEVLDTSPIGSGRLSNGSGTTSPNTTASTTSSNLAARQQPRFPTSAFHSLEKLSTQSSGGVSLSTELPTPDATSHYHNLFSPQSPIGLQYSDRTRVSGKSLIENNFADDDETTDLLNDPLAFAETNGNTSGRRATAPQIPIGRLQTLTNVNVNGNSGPVSASVPSPYGNGIPPHVNPMNQLNVSAQGLGYPMGGNPHYQRHNFPPVNPADQNPPCNTLYVGNLPIDTSEEELKALFSKQRGYKRLCFRTKQNGPMCFVEFEDVSFATKALHELYGQLLHNSVKGGIRLSFSKNPLGVRSGHNSTPANSATSGAMASPMANGVNGFTTANGPPPGLSAPPGLGASRPSFNSPSPNPSHNFNHPGFAGNSNYPWNGAPYPGQTMTTGTNGILRSNNPNQLPPHMMGR